VAITFWLCVGPAAAQQPDSPAPEVAPEDLPRGVLVDPVTSLTDPEHTYALYVPTSTMGAGGWPVLFIMDARGRGALAAGFFHEAAEEYGWIVASSNNSASDGPSEPNVRAIKALLADMERRFTVDPHRAYFAGFSGTAREAWRFGLDMPKSVAGVIPASGGYPLDLPPTADLPFAVFGTAGTTDFNYLEMQIVAGNLDALGLPHRVEVFDGGHTWPPTALCREAVAWMELQAMRRGLRPRDDALVDRLHDRWLAEARALEEAGELVGAYHGYREVVRDFDGLRDVEQATEAVARLSTSEAVTSHVAERKRVTDWEVERRMEVFDLLAVMREPHGTSLEAQAACRSMIRQLERHAASGKDPHKGEAARRVLEVFFVNLSFYLPRDLFGRDDYDASLAVLRLAVEIHDDNPFVWYNIAASEARIGSRKRALDALERAAAVGFGNRAFLEADEDFASVREEERYRAVVEAMGP
jgi:predicted esterase